MLLIKYFHFSNLKRPNVIKVRCRAEICITFASMLSFEQLTDCWCARFRMKGSGVESWPGTLYCVLRKISYRSDLWHRYWGQDSFSTLFFLPPVTIPQVTARRNLFRFLLVFKVAKRKSPLHSIFFRFYHLTYWTVYCNVNKFEKRH